MESGCMASFRGVVEALPETEEVVDQQAMACDDSAGGSLAAATTEENEHDGKAAPPVPDHQGASAPEHAAEKHAAEAPVPEEHAAAAPAPEEHGDEKKDQPVAKKEVEEPNKAAAAADGQEESTRERLKRHRREMAGRVWVPELWGQEKLLNDWVDCAVFDRPMVPTGLLTARRALIAECCTTRRPDRTSSSPSSSTTSSSPPLRVRNGCS